MIQNKSLNRELTFLFLSVFVLAATLVWIRAMTVKSTYQFVDKERQYRQIEQDTQALRVHWLKLTSPKKLQVLAGQLGLEPPKLQQNLKMPSLVSEGKHF